MYFYFHEIVSAQTRSLTRNHSVKDTVFTCGKYKSTSMKPIPDNKPRIPYGWLRAVLFIILYLAVLLIAGKLLQSYLQAKTADPSAGVNNNNHIYVAALFNAVVSLALVWLFRQLIDRRSFASMGFTLQKNGLHAGTGFFLGVFLLCTGSCILYFSKNLQWTNTSFNGNDLFISFGLMLIIAFTEELVFRGYLLNNLLQSVSKWPALVISALIFTLFHAANPDFSIIGAINILLAGLLLGINYIYTKNLWFAIVLHFTWNFLQGPVLGYDVSGLHLQSLLQHDIQGSELLTGGKFGFEGSLVATVLLLLAITALGWVYQKKFAPLPAAEIAV